MNKRFVAIWFRYLVTDWITRQQPGLVNKPFVVATPIHGRMIITALNMLAEQQDICVGMPVADAKAIFPSLEVENEKPGLTNQLLTKLAAYCIRFSPVVAIDAPAGLIIDATGCSHLWGGDHHYLNHIKTRLRDLGFNTRIAITDTIGASWAVSRFGKNDTVIDQCMHLKAVMQMPPAALRIDAETTDRLLKLGLHEINYFIGMPRPVLKRRFGQQIIKRIDQALGYEEEHIQPVHQVETFQDRIVSVDPIVTRTGIEIALNQLLESLCVQLSQKSKGLRVAVFKCFRTDAKIIQTEIGTNKPTHNKKHLFRLFENKLDGIEPAGGIEVFSLEASKTEDIISSQEKLWETKTGITDTALAELLDRLENKFGRNIVHRYLPDEHHWPERSIKQAITLHEKPATSWKNVRLRPVQLLARPESISVTAPVPDYPPMNFRHRGQLYKVIKADGPERIEQEWWLQQGEHRDYYCVEVETGQRFWLFRSGHYTGDKRNQWFLHGFFA